MRFDLGTVTLDTDRHQVFRGAQPLHLSTRAFQLLSMLVENRPRALSKDELQRALWPETFVSDTSLTTLINEIRSLLSETAKDARLIRTVHGYGYAFEGATSPAPPPGCRLIWGEREVPLAEGENILGRDPGARGSIPDASISRRHARITVHGDTATLVDLMSKNGTWVGDHRVTEPIALSDGDAVRLGLVRLVFRAASETSSSTTKTVR
ncbi:MAG: winged helix-turn-helix domain-containing protein [Acidobacteriota bacterium]